MVKQQPLILVFIGLSMTVLLWACVHLSRADFDSEDIQSKAFVRDSGEQYTLKKILALPAGAWQSTDSLNFGATNEKYWAELVLLNNDSVNSRLLVFDDVLLDQVQAWFIDTNNRIIEQYRFGDAMVFDQRPLASGQFVLEVPNYEGELRLIISAKTSVVLNLNLKLWDTPNYLEHKSDLSIFYGIIFGYIFALFCYSMMMYATNANREYVIYAGYLLSFALHLAAVTGHGYHFIWSSSPYFQSAASTLSINLLSYFLLLFTQHVLQLKANKTFDEKLLSYLLKWCMSLVLIGLIYPSAVLVKVSILTMACVTIIAFAVCVRLGLRGSQKARFFALIWGILLASVLASVFQRFGLLPFIVEPAFLIIAGFALESLLIGTALINMYRTHQRHAFKDRKEAIMQEHEMLKAKDSLIAAQRSAQEKLQQQVKAQTAQLESALQELSITSRELSQMRNVDGLTGLANRYVYDSQIEEFAKRGFEERLPLSIAVLDLDHFKQINDKFGHLAGDHALRVFAKILSHASQGTDVFACRFGGEEFVMAAIGKTRQDMTAIVEAVRLELENTLIEEQLEQFSCTVSIGLVVRVPDAPSAHQLLLARADTLLYQAKEAGRNQTAISE